MNNDNIVLIISGPSAVGKSRVIRHLQRMSPQLKSIVSATTRKPRVEEENGRDYFFMSHEEFNEAVQNNDFLEWVDSPYGKYGTLKSQVLNNLSESRDVILDLDPAGALKVKDFISQACSVFLLPPTMAELREHLELRGEERGIKTKEDLEKRMLSVKNYIGDAYKYDYILFNADSKTTAKTISRILEVEKLRLAKLPSLEEWKNRELI